MSDKDTRSTAYYRRMKAAGLCPRCRRPSFPGRVNCEECLARLRSTAKRGRPTKIHAGSARSALAARCPAAVGGTGGCAMTMPGLNEYCRSVMARSGRPVGARSVGDRSEVLACKKCRRAKALRAGKEDAPPPEGVRIIPAEMISEIAGRLEGSS